MRKGSLISMCLQYDPQIFEFVEKQDMQHSQVRKNILWTKVLRSIAQKDDVGSLYRNPHYNYYSHVAELSSRLDVFAVDNVDTN